MHGLGPNDAQRVGGWQQACYINCGTAVAVHYAPPFQHQCYPIARVLNRGFGGKEVFKEEGIFKKRKGLKN